MQLLHQAVTAPQLIARALQIEALQAILDEVQTGTGRCVLLSGEAGIGKSRLLREFVAGLDTPSTQVLSGNCLEHDTSLAYGPLIDALRRFLTPHPPIDVADLPGLLAADLVKILPELALTHPDLPSIPTLPPELEKRRLFETLMHFLARLATPNPLLLIIEDIHWSDETSLEFLHLLIRRLGALPILLLLTTRPQTETPAPARFLAQLNRERLAQEIRLEPLSPRGVDALLRSMFGWDLPLKQPFLNAIYALTEGNPFFVEEVANTLVVNGDIFYADDGWHYKSLTRLDIPHSLRSIVQQRTSQLSPAAKSLLAVAAVAGRTFDFDLLARLTDDDEPALLKVIKELVAAGLVVEESADIFAFRHALTREAIYTGLLSRERRARHQAIAHYYEQQPEPRGQYLPHLAYHFFEAGLWEQALRYAQEAGEQALRNFAPHAALTHFTRAATAATELGQPLPANVRQLRGQAQQMVGNYPAAQADFEAALDEARAAGNALAEWQALHDLGFLWMARDYARTGDYLHQALTLARTLDDPATLAQSLNRLGNWQANVGQPLSALALHQEALAIFEAEGNQPGIAATLDLIATAHGITGNTAASGENYRRALPLLEELGDKQGVASTLMMLTIQGNIPDGEQAVKIAREIGWRDGEAYAHIRLAMAHTFCGQFGPALEHVRQGLDIAREIGHTLWQTAARQSLGTTHLFMLALEEAESHFTQALGLAQTSSAQVWTDSITANLAIARVMKGDVDSAAALLAGTPTPPEGLETLGKRFLALAQGEVALAQEQPQAALAIIGSVLSAVPKLHAWQDRTLCFLLELRGRALAAENRPDEAASSLQEAIALCQTYGVQLWRWRCHANLFRLHLSQKDRDAAEAELAAATQHIEAMAATIPQHEPRQQFQQAAKAMLPQLPALTPLQQSKQAFGGLTQRERQVAALVAQGKSNKEIADELFITVRTVKAHLTNILTKLNFTSRSQVAAWVIETGLLD